jgi:serine/threonine-protein kinase
MLARVSTRRRHRLPAQQVGVTKSDHDGATGRHLSDVIAQSGRVGADEAAVIGITLCQALGAVHGAGLLHRDVKARNVMREDGGRIVLMDFGAGRESVPMPSTRSLSDLSGTPLYLAPELLAGGTASAASDLYSLGVLLFLLVTRKYPVEGTSLSDLVLRHAAGERGLSDLRPDLPAAFVGS